jgi:tetratricopeptide (TPR) repeat protein
MRNLAWLALQQAKRVDARIHGVKWVMNLHCSAWAEYGNACRVGDMFIEAAWALGHAREIFELGTREEDLEIRILELEASLAADRRQFQVAQLKLDKVLKFYTERGAQHKIGLTLTIQGLYKGYSGSPEAGIELIQRAKPFLSADDPLLIYTAHHNNLLFLIDCHRYKEAKQFRLKFSRELSIPAGRVNEIRFRHLEGRIDDGMGMHKRAESTFREVKLAFDAVGRKFDGALASLDLSAVLLTQGQSAEAKALLSKAVQTFLALKIEREAVFAVVLLRDAFDMEKGTVQLIKEVAAFLRRSEHDPETPFAPPAL